MGDTEQKIKIESYANFSGINQKSSKYLTAENEVLNIKNLDFDTLGALSSVPGTTQFMLAGSTSAIRGIAEFTAPGNTYGYGSYTNIMIAMDQYKVSAVQGHTFNNIYSYFNTNNTNSWDTVTAGGALFGTNQWDMIRYPSVTLTFGYTTWGGVTFPAYQRVRDYTAAKQYSLPRPLGISLVNLGSSSGASTSLSQGWSGNVEFSFFFARGDGFVGPPYNFTLDMQALGTFFYKTYDFALPSLNPAGGATYSDFSINSIVMAFRSEGSSAHYISYNPGTITARIGYADFTSGFLVPEETDLIDYFGTFFYGFSNSCGADATNVSTCNQPSCIELYENQMFSGGFFNQPDLIVPSNIGEYEKSDEENWFYFRKGDGDIITCFKAYINRMVIFKTGSIGELAGQDPDNFVLSETSTNYGCISNTGACTWEQKLWFLDREGIAEYNGANTKIVSDKMEYIFRRMNVSAARNTASMVYLKDRNQIHTSIPIDGATSNNMVVIYDTLLDSWSLRDITNGTALAVLGNHGNTSQVAYYGDFSGMIYQYGTSFLTSNGNAVTYVMQSKFFNNLGNSTEKMFRRLFLDATVPSGCTYDFEVNFYKNQGESPALRTTMTLSEFQNRIDFGIAAKDLSVEFIHVGTSFLQLNGFTIVDRFLRDV